VYLDLFSKPYEGCTFDNLPPSQAVPNTFGSKLPKKLQYLSLSGGRDLKSLLSKVDKQVKGSKGGDRTLVMIDNLNAVMLGASPIEWLEAIGDVASWAETTPGVSVCLGVNRDLIDDEAIEVYREAKNAAFDHIFELQRNLSGYTKDVHGQLNIIKAGAASLESLMSSHSLIVKNVKFRLTENKVELFEHFVI
jgi:type IV secretory pathway TrbD component